ncbi:glycosyltransferase family 2 protein [Patescibacteria group bacterium]
MKNKPLISVIIPTHNSEKKIPRAIESIINQTYGNLEIIVVDDNSTDNTKEVIEGFAKKDNRIKYYSLPFDDPNRLSKTGRNINAGYSARNYGIEKARGEWITFQDADDASLLNRIEIQYNLNIKNNSHHLSISYQKLKPELINTELDINKFIKENKDIIIDSTTINKLAKKTKGVIIPFLGNFYKKIPFKIKTIRVINKLFFGSLEPYPASGNCPLVKKEVFEKVRFRQRDERVWPSFVGRGADRDFNFQVAETFKDNVIYKIPLYLWSR